MPFEKFTDVGKQTWALATMSARGVISFNQGALKRYHLDAYTHTVMYFDPDTKTIAFELVQDDHAPGANRLRHIRRNGVDIDAHEFLDHYHLPRAHDQTWRIGQDPETGWLFLRYGAGVGAGKRPHESGGVRPTASVVASRAQPVRDGATDQRASVEAVAKPTTQNERRTDQSVGAPIRGQRETGENVHPTATVAAVAAGGGPARGVKAMISELFKD
jgi:hypothetical protein